MRILLILALAACQRVESPTPTAAPRNFVCERVSIANPKATCVPELNDNDTHSARVTVEGDTVSCTLKPMTSLAVVCGGMFVAPQPPQPAAEPAK